MAQLIKTNTNQETFIHCSIHPHMECSLFCRSDKKLLCPNCLRDHQGHDLFDSSMVLDNSQKVLEKKNC